MRSVAPMEEAGCISKVFMVCIFQFVWVVGRISVRHFAKVVHDYLQNSELFLFPSDCRLDVKAKVVVSNRTLEHALVDHD